MTALNTTHELSLDPEDWSAFLAQAHGMLDDMVAYLRTVRERPAWSPVPPSIKARLSEPPPMAGSGLEETYRAFSDCVLPYPFGNIHPRFWGLVCGTGTPVSMLADLLASAMNSNACGYDQSATYVEQQVVAWFRELFGFPDGASGIFVNGASTANLLGLLVARNSTAPFDVKGNGLAGNPRLRVYASTETHACIKRACNVAGLGQAGLHSVAVNARREIDIDALAHAIHEDRKAGDVPLMVVANAGTVNTGAFDDFNSIADMCAREGLWMHVDGAFGAMAKLAPRARQFLDGMERADSLAFDLHKWGYLSYDVACVLVRDGAVHRAALANPAPYLSTGVESRALAARTIEHGFDSSPLYFPDLGLELSRSFRALKPWMAIKTYGFERLGEQIQQNIDQAAYMTARIDASPELESLADAPLNVVCFRYVPIGHAEFDLNTLNSKLLDEVQTSGTAVFTSTLLEGRFALRAALANHRTRCEDIDLALDAVLAAGRRLTASP
jgi:glutamate/tyrosine decarboxylase-like PLP-dependent enzyme